MKEESIIKEFSDVEKNIDTIRRDIKNEYIYYIYFVIFMIRSIDSLVTIIQFKRYIEIKTTLKFHIK